MTAPDIYHEAIPADIPGKLPLTPYSRDPDRAYAADRDRLSEQYKAATSAFLESVAVFDVHPSLDEVAKAREALKAMRGIGSQLRHLEPPDHLEGAKAELSTFAGATAVRAVALETALGKAEEHAQRQVDQADRADLLKRNRDLGLPYWHGMPDQLMTLDDANARGDDYWGKFTREERNQLRWKLRVNQRRLEDTSTFDLSSALTEATKAVEDRMSHAGSRARAEALRDGGAAIA